MTRATIRARRRPRLGRGFVVESEVVKQQDGETVVEIEVVIRRWRLCLALIQALFTGVERRRR